MNKRPKTEWTARQLAEVAGCSTAYIRRLLIDGVLRGRKIGATWIISLAEGNRWLENRQRRR